MENRSDFRKPVLYTPLNAFGGHILPVLKREGSISWPRAMLKGAKRYCQFHWEKGHDTKQCYQLKMYIQHPIKKGALSQYLKKPLGDDKKRSQEKKEEGEPKKKKEGPRTSNRILNTITTIMGFRARKREAREIASIGYDPYKQSQKSRWYRSEVPA